MEQNQKAPHILRDELRKLRQSLKEQEKLQTGRSPVICSDESIEEMIRLRPRKASDFYSIPGVGPAFIERYARSFLAVLNNTGSNRSVNDSTVETLRELSKKLINMTKNNRMLYMPKLSSKYGVDLFDPAERYDPMEILFGDGSPVTVADISAQDLPRMDVARDRYKNLTNLLRESARDLRDKGQNDLYVGYPFVQGNLVNGEFGIRAPLCLFPVIMERNATGITIAADPTRDIVLNSTLLLAHQKFNSMNAPLPDCVLEEVSPDTFLQEIIDFYADNDIRIDPTGADVLKKFTEYVGESFPKYARGALKMVQNIVVGKFPAYSNSIQRDFDQLLDKGLVNKLVTDLISDYGATDFYSDNSGEDEINRPDKPISIRESSLTYINALNNSQEAVLHTMENQDELVVEGPPGTGKSQTITSLITQFADQGKTILMVSEKKTALDVVYSRLGNLSRYAMMLDDASNKNLFYAQLERLLFSNDGNVPLTAPDLTAISDEIDMNVAILETLPTRCSLPTILALLPTDFIWRAVGSI